MSENHRYYWLKLQETFFEDDTIDFIESQENGERYVLFYLKLCLKALKNEGKLIRYVGELLMPYDEIGIAKLTKTDVDTVRSALMLFSKIGLIKRLDSGEIYLTQLDELIGTETSAAQRKRKQRINEKARLSLKCDNVTDMSQEGHTDIDIDKELELKNKSKDIEISNVPRLTDFTNIQENKSANADLSEKKSKSPYSKFISLHHNLYTQLYNEGKLDRTKCPEEPVYNYKSIGGRFKTLFSNPFYTEERIILAINNAAKDDFVINENHFSLLAILANSQLNKLIEGRISTSTKKNYNTKVGSQVVDCGDQNYDEKF